MRQAVERGGGSVVVRGGTTDLSETAAGGDPAARLARLKALRDQGLITADDYEAKKAQILSRL